MNHAIALPEITLVGFPLGWIGRAEHIRAVARALDATGVRPKICNAGTYNPAEEKTDVEFLSRISNRIAPGIRIYSLNGAETPHTLKILETRQKDSFKSGYNIVFPAWELPHYPKAWARALDRFDEIWTASPFADQSIRPAVKRPVVQLPNACEPHIDENLDRSYFGIPNDRLMVLFFFDAASHTTRKNPWAVIETFRRVAAARPHAPIQLIIKLNNSVHEPGLVERLRTAVDQLGSKVTIIDATLKANEVRNLVRCCDCFLSLHRSEGFGRGLAEAMFFGKPVIATGWSGNMEYMTSDVSMPVRYRLIPVKDGEYPHGENQVWADADVDHATEMLLRVIDDPQSAKAMGDRAHQHMRANYSDAAIGARYRSRLEAIASSTKGASSAWPRPNILSRMLLGGIRRERSKPPQAS